MGVRCFWLERTGKTRLYLRRYSSGDGCPRNRGFYHDAVVPLFDVDERKEPYGGDGRDWVYRHDGPQGFEDVEALRRKGLDIPAWPTACACGVAFEPKGGQVFTDHLYRRVDTGEVRPLRDWWTVPGAMYDAEWLAELAGYRGPDGRSVHVVCPDGWLWCIASRASNCTKPEDTEHKCWVRHGELPNLTVDKGGLTCAAGAGSILTPNYHGFLRSGEFQP